MPFQLLNTTTFGVKTVTRTGVLLDGGTGGYLSTAEIDTTRTYKTPNQYPNAKRIKWYELKDTEVIQPFDYIEGERKFPSKIGISTFGIAQTHVSIIEKEKRVRRWPREWHGDNM